MGGKHAPPIDRFWRFVSPEPMSGCWLWAGTMMANGYAGLQIGRQAVRAHRFAYEALVGPIPPGLMLDHVCHQRMCVNPAHLRPATRRQNMSNLRGKSSGRYSSTHTGVSWDSERKKWAAHIRIDGRHLCLGRFESETDAAEAYKAARVVQDTKDVS